MKIAVLGSGNGGCAVAFDCAQHGHRVNLFDFETFPDQIDGVKDAGGIYAAGELEGFAPIQYAGHDIEKALKDVEMIIAVGPAYSTRPFAEACQAHLRKGQMILICPGSCGGSLEFKIGAGLALGDSDIIVAETSTLPYAVRMVGPAKIKSAQIGPTIRPRLIKDLLNPMAVQGSWEGINHSQEMLPHKGRG